MHQRHTLPLVRLSLVLPFVLELDRLHLNTHAVLAENGLVRESVLDPNVFVPPIVINRFLEDAARAAADPYLGVRVGESLNWADWPPLVDAVSQAETLGDFLVRFIRSARNEASSAHHMLEIGAQFAVFQEKRTSEQEIVPAQNDAFTAAFTLGLLSRGAGKVWSAAQVWLTVCTPDALPARYMGTHVVAGDSMGISVRFPCAWLLEHFDRAAFAQPSPDCSPRQGVPTAFLDAMRQALTPHLHVAELNVKFVARLIGTSQQGLQRRLRAGGTTLSGEVRALKKIRAIDDLLNTGHSITQIAASLGFNNPTSFTRAFRSWTGTSPRDYRNKHRTR